LNTKSENNDNKHVGLVNSLRCTNNEHMHETC